MLLKDFAPKLRQFWSSNNTISFDEISSGSNRKVLWVCDLGHEWGSKLSNLLKHGPKDTITCPFCSNRLLLTGFNDLATTHPDIAKEWDYLSNAELSPQTVLAGARVKINWVCQEGHTWTATLVNRKNGTGCPECYLEKVQTSTKAKPVPQKRLPLPENLVSEWHPTKNEGILPEKVSQGSGLKIWWLCSSGHEWKVSPNKRIGYSTGCPYCAGTKVLKGFNDLATLNPTLAEQWHTARNKNLSPSQVTVASKRKVWWLCSLGHEWEATVEKRNLGNGCPYCVNQQVLPGYNDVATLYPGLLGELANEEDKNRLISLGAGSDDKFLWKCQKGHKWEARLRSRAYDSSGCPHCVTSQAEQTLASYIESLGIGSLVKNTRKVIPPFEVDIYIPEKNLAIEFNGVYWHSEANGKDKWYHYNKWETAKKKGIQLIQIWEDEWNRNPEQVKRMLAHKLGVVSGKKVYARKTRVAELSKKQMDAFLDENHIQGSVDGGVRLGLVSDDVLVAAMLLKTEAGSEGKSLNLLRFATSVPVPGGFTKLIKATRELFPEVTQVVTFSDNCVSDGGLYENNGFVAEKQLDPDYRYVVKGVREHKFNYRLKRFRNDPELQYVEGLSESQLAKLNNLPRIWDCGKTKWVLYW